MDGETGDVRSHGSKCQSRSLKATRSQCFPLRRAAKARGLRGLYERLGRTVRPCFPGG
ncbi:hypothetical protein AB395_00003215 [Sinorhizobium fredii CCBAU 45436]|nr:hypothetical protein AB395_00003215 [Sinorhizobium fredii CCBAU 45436]AWM26564.1 hypothetical protein AOX55_00003326 [Sinorhizobium fredii CCBAU 25509]